MTRFSPRPKIAGAILLIALLFLALGGADAGPQHWGFGMSYLATLRQMGDRTCLVVYEGPIRAKNTAWIPRWIDRTTDFSNVVPGGIVVGSFWPSSTGLGAKDHLVTIAQAGTTLTIRTHEPPECFAVAQWTLRRSVSLTLSSGSVIAAAAGDVLGLLEDQLLLLVRTGTNLKVVIITAPSTPASSNWVIAKQIALSGVAGDVRGFAAGDFWGDGAHSLAVATSINGATQLTYYSYNSAGAGSFSPITTDAATDLPALAQNGLVAADYVKDKFDVLTLVPADPGQRFECRVAPARPGQGYNPGPWYTGRSVSRQTLPGNGGASSVVVMTGSFSDGDFVPSAVAAGRVFGYVTSTPTTQLPVSTAADAEISFTHRTPIKGDCPNYGWPAKGQTVNWEINLKNNGAIAIPSGAATLRVWINTPYRNADTNPATCDTPDLVLPVTASLPAFDPANPSYYKQNVSCQWPYDLVPCGPGATYMKLDLEGQGERWLVVALDCTGDLNRRNNRYEAMIGGKTFHPSFVDGLLANRGLNIAGDPSSIEYLARKLADAVLCMWERSGTTDNSDALERPYFDSYEIGIPDSARWNWLIANYEGPRGLGCQFGLNERWERFDWDDGGGELHETGHLYHPLDDLYQYCVKPTQSLFATMADGTPVQFATHIWYPDSFGTGHAVLNLPDAEVSARTIVGTRQKVLPYGWNNYIPKRVWVRVLDRDGVPVPNARVSLWLLGCSTSPYASETTDADGRWEITSYFGTQYTDEFGRTYVNKTANNGLTEAMAQLFTVQIGSYQDSDIWGMRDVEAHCRVTTLYHSYVHEDGWTWDFRTNYKASAPEPTFAVETCTQGYNVKIGITGKPAASYRLYRRWEPAYIRTLIGTYTAQDAYLSIMQDLLASDSHGGGRTRAIYEITELTPQGESLPRTVAVVGMRWVRGISTRNDGKLLVAENAGLGNPFVELFDGTTAYMEIFCHWRFGHTANKAVQSRLRPAYYYVNLYFADDPSVPYEYFFDWMEPPTAADQSYYGANINVHAFAVRSFTTTPPYTITLWGDTDRLHPGDFIASPTPATIIAKNGAVLTTDVQVFQAGATNLQIDCRRLAGRQGSDATRRELLHARGLDVILLNGKEYVAIADTGNHRVVLWDDRTGFVTLYQLGSTAKPAGVAAHPLYQNKFFVLDRRSDRASQLYLFTFDGTSLAIDSGYPVSVDVGDYSDNTYVREIGLAAAADPAVGGVALAVTDASRQRIIELRQVGGTWQTVNTYTQVTGTYLGPETLQAPLDVAYVVNKTGLAIYATDAPSTSDVAGRVVRVAERAFTGATPASAKALADGTVVSLEGVTTAVFSGLSPARFYVESKERTGGIQARCATSLPAADRKFVGTGTMQTDAGTRERYADIAVWQTSDRWVLQPIAMTTGALGGGPQGLQEGVADGVGIGNIGLLVRLCGTVVFAAPDYSYIYISDGSGVSDGSVADGVRVDMSAIPAAQRIRPPIGSSVVVTGISTTWVLGADIYRMLRLRTAADLVALW